MNKIFFFDIDGTLIDCPAGLYEPTKKTIDALNELKANGSYICLSTGRCKCFIVDEVMKYPFDGFITCNGGYVEFKSNPVFKQIVPSMAIKITHDLSKKYNWLYYFESNDFIYVLDKNDPKHIVFRNAWKMKEKTIIDNYDCDTIECYIGMVVINKEEEIELLNDKLGKYFDIQRHQHGLSFDLTLKGTSKGNGILELAKYLNIDIKDTIAFGDGRNDIEMLETAGIGVAMGNAVEEAKSKANYITKSVLEDGIEFALKEFSFIKN